MSFFTTTKKSRTAKNNRKNKNLRVESLEDRKMFTAADLLGLTTMPVVTGDFNSDGYADTATGMPTYGGRAGRVNVNYGTPSAMGYAGGGKFDWFQQGRGAIHGTPQRNDRFGHSLAVGDFNADGIDDLAIGVPGEGGDGRGGVHVLFGKGGHGLVSSTSHTHAPQYIASASGGLGLGRSLAAGDFNGDGYDDLAVGAPDGNQVHVHYRESSGSRFSPQSIVIHEDDADVPYETCWKWGSICWGGPWDLRSFGYSLVSGDFDNNGVDDLAVGSPDSITGKYHRASAGAVHTFYGFNTGLNLAKMRQTVITQDFLWGTGESEIGDYFGASLASGDLNGDGYDDLAIGVPGEDIKAGAVDVVHGGLVGLNYNRDLDRVYHNDWARNAPDHWTQDDVGEIPEPYDYFGASLSIGDVDENGMQDLIIGIPGEDIYVNAYRTIENGGAVAILKGFGNQLKPSNETRHSWQRHMRPEVLHQNRLSTSNLNSASDGEFFGASVATGNIDGRGVDEIVVGIPQEHLTREDRGDDRVALRDLGRKPSLQLVTRKRAADSYRTPTQAHEAKDFIWAQLGDKRTTGKNGSILRGEVTPSQEDSSNLIGRRVLPT